MQKYGNELCRQSKAGDGKACYADKACDEYEAGADVDEGGLTPPRGRSVSKTEKSIEMSEYTTKIRLGKAAKTRHNR